MSFLLAAGWAAIQQQVLHAIKKVETIADCEAALLQQLESMDTSALRYRSRYLLAKLLAEQREVTDAKAEAAQLRSEIMSRFQQWVAHFTGPDVSYDVIFGTAQAIWAGKVVFGTRTRISLGDLNVVSEIAAPDAKKEAAVLLVLHDVFGRVFCSDKTACDEHNASSASRQAGHLNWTLLSARAALSAELGRLEEKDLRQRAEHLLAGWFDRRNRRSEEVGATCIRCV